MLQKFLVMALPLLRPGQREEGLSHRLNGGTLLSPRIQIRTYSSRALFGLILAVTVWACADNPAENQQRGITRKSYVSIQNPNNPFNQIGVWHNEGLDYVAEKASSADPSLTELRKLIAMYMAEEVRVGDVVKGDTIWYGTQFILDSIVRAYDFEDTLATWTEAVSFSPEQQAFIDAILGEAKTIGTPISTSKRNSSMAVFNQVETNILRSPTLSPAEKRVPLALVAVAKHSLEYWSDYPEYYRAWFDEGLGKTVDKKKIKKIVFEDAKGMIFGAFTGFWGGLVTGGINGLLGGPLGAAGGAGVGAVVGSAGGAIAGALGASLVEAAKK